MRSSLRVVALAAAALMPAVVMAAAPANFTLGLLAQFTTTGSANPVVEGVSRTLSDYVGLGSGSAAYAAAAYRISKINADAANNGALLPNTRLLSVFYDDQMDSARGSSGATDLLNRGASIVLGASGSAPAATALPVLNDAGKALLSWSSVSSEFTNSKNYLRVCQNDADLVKGMVAAAKHFNWNKVAILSTNGVYGTTGASGLKAAAANNSITILTEQSFAVNGDASAVNPAISNIKAHGANIILFFGHAADWAVTAAAAKAANMFNNETVWMLSGSSLVSPIFSAQQKADWAGVLGVTAFNGVGTNAYDTWKNEFTNAMAIKSGPPELMFNGTEADFAWAPYANDAVLVLATALHELIEVQGVTPNNTNLFDQIKKTQVNGATGSISFDANGDRIGVTFVLQNMYQSAWTTVGSYNPASGSYTASQNPIFIGGSTTIPVAAGSTEIKGNGASTNSASIVSIVAAFLIAAVIKA